MTYVEFINRVGKHARRVRIARGMTQQEIADAAGINLRVYANLERGHGSPVTRSLFLIAAALELTMVELVAAAKQPRPAAKGPAKKAAPKSAAPARPRRTRSASRKRAVR